jgi:hypothetical protein
LLANLIHQTTRWQLAERVRQQAGSYRIVASTDWAASQRNGSAVATEGLRCEGLSGQSPACYSSSSQIGAWSDGLSIDRKW